MHRLAIRISLGVAALVTTCATHAGISAPEPTMRSAAAHDSADAGPRRGLARIATFGFDALVADYRWLEAVQLAGHEGGDVDATEIGRLVETVVALDPFVDHPYRFASLWLVDDPEQVRVANRILERGIAYHPAEWRNRFYLSFNHMFYLGDSTAAARELEPAIHLDGAPRYIGRLLARLRSDGGDLEAAATYLEQLARDTEDPWKRAEYEKALDEIETERRARVLDRAREVFRTRHGRDIERIEELAEGPGAVLPSLPPELHGWGWVLDPESGQIESGFYGDRYRLHMHATDRQRLNAWKDSGALAPERGDRE